MSDVLDQSDIDALLSAVAEGEVEDSPQDTLIFSRQRRHREAVEIRDYDFRRPERISKDQMRSLQTLHENFARNFGASLSGYLRTIVEVRVAHAEQMTYAEFISGLPNPTSFNLLSSDDLEGQLCLEVSPLIVYPIIDRLLGGSNQDLFIPQRPMTLIEQRLIRTILERGMGALGDAWEGVRAIRFRLGEMESNPQIVQIVPPNEVVVVIVFEIKLTNRAGTMSLCIPFNVIEPLVEDLSTRNWFLAGKSRGEIRWADRVAERIAGARVELRGVLAETTITLADLRSLEVGDIIMTERPAVMPVVVVVEGKPKFLARIGQHRGHRALAVARPVRPGERL
ncbi:MAG: flagellar motor switch protein FliM [Phycisphaeraceae bacterium]|nr:flagellar motor switch protein FliM [Phycisphaeraceae bacterium]